MRRWKRKDAINKGKNKKKGKKKTNKELRSRIMKTRQRRGR
jgi:hypothetical protein